MYFKYMFSHCPVTYTKGQGDLLVIENINALGKNADIGSPKNKWVFLSLVNLMI